MPANNPNSPNAATVQGPGPTGNEGYPIATVPATSADPWPTDGSDLAANQSTQSPLGINGTFTGPYEDITQYASISIIIFSDQNSQTLGVRLHFSTDGVNVDFPEEFSFTATQGRSIIVPARAQFFRLQYQNGSVAQGILRIETHYRRKPYWNAGDTLTQDGKSVLATTTAVSAYLHVFNGTGWDRLRSNLGAATLLASAARTTTAQGTSPLQQNFTANGTIIYLNVTAAPAVPGAGGLRLAIEAQDVLALVFTQLNGTSAPLITTTGSYIFVIYPGAVGPGPFPGSGGRVIQTTGLPLPRSWRAVVQHLDAQSYTYSLSQHYTE